MSTALGTFRGRIRAAIEDPTLQAALDANAERRGAGRAAAFASLPDWQERRQRAHAVRAAVIADLDTHLGAFIRNAEANGLHVHRARDAAEASAEVLRLATATNQRPLVAKSKSMVSEEIRLNEALEAAGIRVVETDLGEYIVQLRGERPSHIITPAVHLRRQEVGRLFQEKLGVPYTEDVAEMTATARRVLREVFLSADVGISGVNFGVVESGSLCIISNEGNARMVTTLPRLHIALMGIERIVPTFDDLALMLSLLPRSATGQKLTVYTQLIRRPLPGQERHVILVDNGRSALRLSKLAEALYCIRCGACLNACPVFRELGGHAYASVYPGPIGSVVSAAFFGPEFAPLAQASTLCGACKEACPVDIDLPKLLTRVRAGMSPVSAQPLPNEGAGPKRRETRRLSRRADLALRMYGHVARRPHLFAAAQKLASVASRVSSPFQDWVRLPAFTGWGLSKDLPRFAWRTFRRVFRSRVPTKVAAAGLQAPAQIPASQAQDAEPLVQIAGFAAEVERVGGRVIPATQATVSRAVADFLRGRGLSQAQMAPGVLDAQSMADRGIIVQASPDPTIPVGITNAAYAIADSGSIIVLDGPDGALSASLLPEIHIAILSMSRLLPTLDSALRIPELCEAASAVVITGPSRTGDIEMTHTIGVHGPRELVVFLVE